MKQKRNLASASSVHTYVRRTRRIAMGLDRIAPCFFTGGNTAYVTL